MLKIPPLIIITFLFSTCTAQDTYYKNYQKPLDILLDSLKIEQVTIRVLIDKSEFKLSIQTENQIIKEYPVVLGGNPTDDKLMQGDQCTPEGTFHIISKYPHQNWTKFIWLDYPNDESWVKHHQAKHAGIIPEDAKIGGEIGIHGVPKNADWLISSKQNWTLGCISLRNNDINEIYPFITEKTPIIIVK